ncbi:PulJ/GspJ family protein [Desulfonatronum thioautotrophicum]|uniref:PulJ/GspJ family protein n=1 Tax=Desulfonatronum thioautotrophicum TaxID=617001 RepID=UPI0024465F7C|nr:prepilin-type N-terminal cleavage/methylation domain-containing protein [Desulfonatronum thioautotrophicum]
MHRAWRTTAPASRLQARRPAGFTLMEVLVAVIIVAMTVTVFFQLLSASMNLERKGRDMVRDILIADRLFGNLQRLDIREPDFPWSGEAGGLSWRLEIHPVEIEDMMLDDPPLRLPTELFRYEFHYSADKKPYRVIHRYVTHPPDFFDASFRSGSFTRSD